MRRIAYFYSPVPQKHSPLKKKYIFGCVKLQYRTYPTMHFHHKVQWYNTANQAEIWEVRNETQVLFSHL